MSLVWAAVTNYHRLSDLNSQDLFLVILEVGYQRSKHQKHWFLVKVLSWVAHGWLLIVSSHDRKRNSPYVFL